MAKAYMSKIIDAWNFLWNEDLGTVPPDKLTMLAMNIITRHRNKRVVVHYLQPHAPYITPKFRTVGYLNLQSNPPLSYSVEMKRYNKLLSVEKRVLRAINIFQKLGLRNAFYSYLRIRKMLGLPPLNPVDDFIRRYGVEKIFEAYASNLMIVIANVAALIDGIRRLRPNAKIVITSDHGECLGEQGCLEHPAGVEIAQLREVPVFIVESANVRLAWRYLLKWKIEVVKFKHTKCSKKHR